MSLLSVVGLVVGCSTLLSPSLPAAHRPSLPRPPGGTSIPSNAALHVVLIAIDGVRPREIFSGAETARGGGTRSPAELAPAIHALAQRGIALGRPLFGAGLRASGPHFVSLPGYTELLTGSANACDTNDCEPAHAATLLDAFADPGGAPLAVVTSWSRIGRVTAGAPDGTFVSTGRAAVRGMESVAPDGALVRDLAAGARAAPSPCDGDYRPDAFTIALARDVLDAAAPRFMFVSLGDTDEYAHAGDYDGYLAALARADAFVGDVSERAARWDAAGEPTLVVVTTDHGRADDFADHGRDYPESADVWLVAAGQGISPRGEVALATPAHLADVAPTIAALAGVEMPGARGRDPVSLLRLARGDLKVRR